MKSTTILFTALLSSALTLSACKKDEASPTSNNNNSTTSSFTFKVDGSTVTVDSANAVLYTLGVAPHNREIDVFAYKGGRLVLEFHFLPRTGAQAAAQSFAGSWLTYVTPATQYHSQSGTLTLTTCDTTGNRIEGRFDFVGQQIGGSATKTISEGTLLVTRLTRQ